MKKTLTTVVTGMAFVAALSGLAFAGQPNAQPASNELEIAVANDNIDSAVAQDGSTAVYVDDVTKKDFDNSFNTNEEKTVTVTKTIDITDSFKNENSNNEDNSIKIDKSIKDSFNIEISDIKIAVAQSELSGEVSGNTIDAVGEIETGNARISDNAFQHATGIVPVAQNTGINSQIQQSVNVQAFGLK